MAPWCPACRSFKETWSNLAKWGRDLDIQVGVIDVTESPGTDLVNPVVQNQNSKCGEVAPHAGVFYSTDFITKLLNTVG